MVSFFTNSGLTGSAHGTDELPEQLFKDMIQLGVSKVGRRCGIRADAADQCQLMVPGSICRNLVCYVGVEAVSRRPGRGNGGLCAKGRGVYDIVRFGREGLVRYCIVRDLLFAT